MSSFSKPYVTRRSSCMYMPIVSFLCLLIGISGFLLGFAEISLRGQGNPLSVHVKWDKSSKGDGMLDNGMKRPKVIGFVGVQTGFEYQGRRRALRQTWFPSDRQAMQRFEESIGLVFRFVIGTTSDNSKMMELKKEVEEYHDFLILDNEDNYKKLPYKTLGFFKAAYALYDAKFYIKADDDIYLRPDRLSLFLAKDRPHSRSYIVCMIKGHVLKDPKSKWFEPSSYLLGDEYFLYGSGPIYGLSADVVSALAILKNDSLRLLSNEDVSVGLWMLALDANHENVKELCETECSTSSIAVWMYECSGVCDPDNTMMKIHARDLCSKN